MDRQLWRLVLTYILLEAGGCTLVTLGFRGTYLYDWWGRYIGAAMTSVGLLLVVSPWFLSIGYMKRQVRRW